MQSVVLELGERVRAWNGPRQPQLAEPHVAVVDLGIGFDGRCQHDQTHQQCLVGGEPGEHVVAVRRRVEVVGQCVEQLAVAGVAVQPRLDHVESDVQRDEQRDELDAGVDEAGLQDAVELEVGDAELDG